MYVVVSGCGIGASHRSLRATFVRWLMYSRVPSSDIHTCAKDVQHLARSKAAPPKLSAHEHSETSQITLSWPS